MVKTIKNAESESSCKTVFSNYTTVIYTDDAKKYIEDLSKPIKTVPKSLLRKSNLNNGRVENNILKFDISFIRDEETTIKVPYTGKSAGRELLIHLSKPDSKNDPYGFSYFSLEVWDCNPNTATTLVIKTRIPNSWKGACDCVAYMHNIYRDNEWSCYEAQLDLSNDYLTSRPISVA